MNFVNLTPHAIHIYDADNAVVRTISASGQQARYAVTTTPRYELDGISFVSTVFGALSGLPDPDVDTIYIVSLLVKQAVPLRADVVSPGEMVRDANGNIVGCKNFNV